MKRQVILVPGGAGFIGSHVVVELLQRTTSGVVVVDNLSNATANENDARQLPPSLERVLTIVKSRGDLNNNELADRLDFRYAEYDDAELLKKLQETYDIVATIIVAGFKAVGESKHQPLKYYKNNVCKTVSMLETLTEINCKNIIFSSSATVYNPLPEEIVHAIDEHEPTGICTCPYARTKSFIEEILKDVCYSDPNWNCISLRYFNPVGAHPSGLIGEDPQGIPNNLMPMISQVAVGRRPKLSVFGNDYPTPDGTGVRDYLHVVDLATAHVDAVLYLKKQQSLGFKAINLGSGTGHSVLEVISSFEKAAGFKLNWAYAPRRAGDISTLFCNPTFAENILNWKTTKSLDEMCADTWNFQKNNPYGYSKTDPEAKS